MTWATPHTWVHGEFVDEDLMNDELKTHLNELWKYDDANQILVAVATDELMILDPTGVADTVCITADDGEAGGVKWYTTIPIGAIVMWSGSVGTIPAGFRRCDGTNGTPDLQDRFVIGAGSTYAVGATGGSVLKDFGHSHVSAVPISEFRNTWDASTPVATIGHSHTTSDPIAFNVIPPNRPLYFIMRTDA